MCPVGKHLTLALAQGVTLFCTVSRWASRSSTSLSHRHALFMALNVFLGLWSPSPDVHGLSPRAHQQAAGGHQRIPALMLSGSLRSWIFHSPVAVAGDNAAFLWRRGFHVIASLHANTFAVIIVLWGLIKKTLKSKFLR